MGFSILRFFDPAPPFCDILAFPGQTSPSSGRTSASFQFRVWFLLLLECSFLIAPPLFIARPGAEISIYFPGTRFFKPPP